MRFRFTQVLPLLVLGHTLLAFAQRTSAVSGFVLDLTGAAIPGATLRIQQSSGSVSRETQSGPKGEFSFTSLPAGDYSLVIPAYSGFAARMLPVHLQTSIFGLKVTLVPPSVSQTITVGADDSTLTTDSATNRDTVAASGDQMRDLPVFDQDYVAALMPFLDASSGASGGLILVVDGVEMKSVGMSPSAIQEVRINNDPYSTEFNRPGRGRIEITSKPGSSDFHGEANFIFRDAIFNAKYFPALVRPPEARRIYEGHFTGPLGHGGHTNFIASTSVRQRDTAVVVDASTPNGQVNENVLAPNHNAQAALRVTHDFSPAHRLQVGYNFEYATTVNTGVGGIVLPEAGYDTASREDDLIFNDRIIISPSLINQFLVTFEKDEDVTTSVTEAPSIQVSGSFTGGGAQADLARTENTVHVNEVVSLNHGKHYIRFGAQLPQVSKRAVDDHTDRLGTLSYASLANYTSNTPYFSTVQTGTGRGLYWANEIGAFIQDQITLTPKLQVSLGVRYDWQTYLSDNNNLAPRASLAYSVDGGKTIIRLGSGVFYDRTGGDFPGIVKLHNGVVLQTLQVQNPGPNSAPVHSGIVRFASNVRAPYTFQSSFGIEHQIHKTITVTAAYRDSIQVKSFRSRDANAPILPPNPSLTAVYPRLNPNVGEIQQIESGGRQVVNALDLSFRGRAGRWFSGQAQYTLARAESNTGGINWFPQNQYDPNNEWGRANFDRLHSFNLLGNINPGHWLTLGVSATLYSGTPYNETTGDDNFHTGLGNARPAGVGRNTLQAGGTADLDLIWNHDFQLTKATGDSAKILTAGVSAFNILNHANYTTYIGALSSSLFGQPTAALPGRQMQFSFGYRF
jgi:hypothetical protein